MLSLSLKQIFKLVEIRSSKEFIQSNTYSKIELAELLSNITDYGWKTRYVEEATTNITQCTIHTYQGSYVGNYSLRTNGVLEENSKYLESMQNMTFTLAFKQFAEEFMKDKQAAQYVDPLTKWINATKSRLDAQKTSDTLKTPEFSDIFSEDWSNIEKKHKDAEVELGDEIVNQFSGDPLVEAASHVIEDGETSEDDEEFPVNNTYAQASDALDNNSMSTRTTNVELYNIMQVVDGLLQGKTYYREDWQLEDSILVYVKPEYKVTSMQIADNNFVNATYANPVDFYSYDFMTNELTPYNLTLEDFKSTEWLVFDGEE